MSRVRKELRKLIEKVLVFREESGDLVVHFLDRKAILVEVLEDVQKLLVESGLVLGAGFDLFGIVPRVVEFGLPLRCRLLVVFVIR